MNTIGKIPTSDTNVSIVSMFPDKLATTVAPYEYVIVTISKSMSSIEGRVYVFDNPALIDTPGDRDGLK